MVCHVWAVGGGYVDASLPPGNTFYCPLVAQGRVSKEVLEGISRGNGFWESVHKDFDLGPPAWSFDPVTTRFFKQCSARMIRWETMGLLVGHGPNQDPI